MIRPLKFRGRVPDSDKMYGGKIVCGSLLDYGESTSSCPQFWIRPKNSDINYPVDENSIAQLVGYDKDGREVYAGDTVIDEFGNDTVAALVNNLFPPVQLKEAQS